MRTAHLAVAVLLGIAAAANGVIMLVTPVRWYIAGERRLR